ncbi:VOC family protein [Cohnella sp. CFH 77786]|uniref:VOC family protein n=1 Tax=Cohnella sp. CFH 77786 TaxID=2662265 RepID=UPI001C609DB2|nr:VOC family protein [Cohnella sp. CFH 77786]
MITQIGTVAVYVDDQQKAKTFWTEKAGFELRRETPMTPEASWIEVAPPGAQSCLVIYPKMMMAASEEMKASIVFLCDDIQGTFERMKSAGVKFLEEPNAMPWGTYARFQDEDGNEFILKG